MTNIKAIRGGTDPEVIACLNDAMKHSAEIQISDIVIAYAARAADGTPIYGCRTSMKAGWELLAALIYAQSNVTKMLTED